MLIYTLRPNNTSLWLPEKVANELKLKHGDKLTPSQFRDTEVQKWLAQNSKSKTANLEAQ